MEIRAFRHEDAGETAQVIADTLRTSNRRDYPAEYIEANIASHSAEVLIEIPASITAVEFYRKMGYDYKNGYAGLDEEQVYRLEKFR